MTARWADTGSPRNHYLCRPCWDQLEPGREPHVLAEEHREAGRCCRCGQQHRSGIYRHGARAGFACGGAHA